jgi:predicted dienelactone hydrolase
VVNAALRGYALAVLLAVVAATLPLAARAGMGFRQLPAAGADAPVTVFYPTDEVDQPVRTNTVHMLAPNAAAKAGNGRLVVMSHGLGGSPWAHADLARVLVEAGFVVAAPLHRGDNFRDMSSPGPASWKTRPGELSLAIDAVAADAALGPLVDAQRVGIYGMSAGGHTALSMAGGRWSSAGFRRHCEAHIADDFPACAALRVQLRGDGSDEAIRQAVLSAIRSMFQDETPQVHDDARVRAVVAAVPYAADFDAASLLAPRVPLGLVLVGRDKWLAPQLHGGALLARCQSGCELVAQLPTAGHGSLLAPPPPLDALGPIAADLLADPPGFDRALLPAMHAAIADFFRRHLLP